MATFDENGNYIKTDWKAGDKITAAKLNKIEESIEAVNNNDISRHVEADARLDKLESGVVSDKQEMNAKVDALEDVVEANKDAADLEIYSINQHMTLLDKKIDDGVAEVEAIANAVDGKIFQAETNMNNKISQAETNMQNQVNQGKADMEAMVAEVEGELDGIKKSRSYIPISQFGEISSDDNTELFNNALENIPEYSIIDLEGKEFRIKNIEINKSNIGFRNGKLITCITNAVGYYNASIAIRDNNTNIIFEDISIELDGSNIGLSLKPRGIVIVKSDDVKINRCKFLNFQQQPVRVEKSSNVSIQDCTFINCSNLDGYGSISIFMSDDITVDGNKMYNNGVGVSVYGKSDVDYTKNIRINNNYIQGDIDNTNGMGVYCLKNIDRIQVNNNFIENYKNECIVFTNISNPGEFKIKNIQANNNSCYNFLYAGISCDVDCENVVINGNLLEGPSQPILIKTCENVIVSNNNIIGTGGGNSHGVNIQDSKKVEVLNNNIKGLFLNSIYNNQSVFISICNNSIDIPVNGVGIGYYQPNGVNQQGLNIIGNFLNAEDTSVPLLKHRGGDNLRRCLISNNYCISGTLNIDYAQYTYIINNVFLSINSSYTLYDNGTNCIIKDNQGIKNTNVDVLDNYGSLPTINPARDRGRIIQVQGTTDMYYICNQSGGTYAWKRIQLID